MMKLADQIEMVETKYDKSQEEAATELGMRIVYPERNQLQLDIDTEEAYATYKKNLPIFERVVGKVAKIMETRSKSGNRHITLTMAGKTFEAFEMDDTRRVLYQALLGSDQTRELLNLERINNDVASPSVFFEVP
jgi:hypothetical protein